MSLERETEFLKYLRKAHKKYQRPVTCRDARVVKPFLLFTAGNEWSDEQMVLAVNNLVKKGLVIRTDTLIADLAIIRDKALMRLYRPASVPELAKLKCEGKL